jgi:hypothetical protein
MRLIKWVPVVAFSAVCSIPASVMAQQWIVRCDSPSPTPLCLDATTNQPSGRMQLSECDKTKTYQQWDANKPKSENIQNRGMNNCVDIYVYSDPDDNEVVTNKCDSSLEAQEWSFEQTNPNGAPIQNEYTGQYLGGLAVNHATVEPVPYTTAPKWRFANVGDMRLGCPPM